MADTASKHIDMTTGSLWRNIPLFAFPVAATSILEQLSNLIATVIIGNFSGRPGNPRHGGGRLNVPLTSLMLNLFYWHVAWLQRGHRQRYRPQRSEHGQTRRPYLDFNGARGLCRHRTGRDLCRAHARCAQRACRDHAARFALPARLFLSMPSILLYNFEAAIFRSVGITRMPLQALAVSTVLNIGLDLIFVPVLHWGVAGVAIATAIAYTVSAATLFIRLLKTDSVVRVTPRDLGLDPVALKRIVKIGLPAGIQSAVFAVANIIIQSAINSLGTEVMAASSAAMSLGTCATTCSTALARPAPPLWDKTTVPAKSTAAPRRSRSA